MERSNGIKMESSILAIIDNRINFEKRERESNRTLRDRRKPIPVISKLTP
jgi:hypothetical protein